MRIGRSLCGWALSLLVSCAVASPTLIKQAVPAPSGLTAVGEYAAVSLQWGQVSGATSYTVLRATSASGPFSPIVTGLTTNTYFDARSITGSQAQQILNYSSTYYYEVEATTSAGTSLPSSAVSANTLAPAFSLTTRTVGTSIVVTAPSTFPGITTLWRGTALGGPYTSLHMLASGSGSQVTPTPMSFTDNTASPGTTYYYRFFNDQGWLNGDAQGTAGSNTVPVQIIPNPSLGFLPDAMTFPGWMEHVAPVDRSGANSIGPASTIEINLAHGVVDVDSGADLVLSNPTGDDVVFERRYRTAIAMGNLSSPGLPPGWTHNWDYRIVPLVQGDWGNLQLVYPNGASETLTPSATNLSAAFAVPAGAPYTASGQASVTPGTWTSIVLKENGLAQEIFQIPAGDSVYRLITKTLPNGSVLNFSYSGGCLTGITDGSNGMQLSLTYGGAANYLNSATDMVTGNTRTYTYSSGVLSSVSNIGNTATEWTYQYTTLFNAPYLSSVTTQNPLGNSASATIQYDSGTGRAILFQDAKGNSRAYTYTDAGSATATITAPSGAVGNPDNYVAGFDTMGRLVSMTTAAGDTTAYSYGGADPSLPTFIQPPIGNSTNVLTDTHGNPTRITYPYGNYTVYTWSYPNDAPLGRVTSQMDYGSDGSDGGQTTYSYYGVNDPNGKDGFLKGVTLPNGGTYGYSYTSLGNLATLTTSSVTLNYTYVLTDSSGNVIAPERYGRPYLVDDGQNMPARLGYDLAGRVTSLTDRLGNVTTSSFDAYDDLVSATLPMGRQIQIGYGALGKLPTYQTISSSTQSPQTQQFNYDLEAVIKSVLDENSLTNSVALDEEFGFSNLLDGNSNLMHQLVEHPTSRSEDTIFGTGSRSLMLTNVVDKNGNPLSSTGSDGRTTTIVNKSSDPSLVQSVTSQSSAEGTALTTYTYDGLERISTSSSAIAPPNSSSFGTSIAHAYQFDAEDNLLEKDTNGNPDAIYTYNPDGSRNSMFLKSFLIFYQYTYDVFGRLVGITVNSTNSSQTLIQPPLATVSYGYDANGRVTVVRTPRADVFYTYDALGEITAIQNVTPDGAPDPGASSSYQFTDPYTGALHTILSSFTNITYNQKGQITGYHYVAESQHSASTGGTGTNAAQGTLVSAPAGSVFISGGVTYTYDAGGRIVSESWAGGPTFTYGFDGGDNLTTLRGNSWGVDAASDQMTGSSMVSGYSSPTFNLSGDVTREGGTIFSYDPSGRPKLLTGSPVAQSGAAASSTFTYQPLFGADGLRASQSVALTTVQGISNSRTDQYLYDGDQLVARFSNATTGLFTPSDLSTSTTVFYIWGPTGPIMEFDGHTASRTFTFDPTGNCVATSNGLVSNPMLFDAFGLPLISYTGDTRTLQQPFQYKGQAGYLIDGYSGLYYCASRYYDAVGGRWTSRDPIGLEGGVNVYEYCGGDPINGVDPLGQDWFTDVVAGWGDGLTFGLTVPIRSGIGHLFGIGDPNDQINFHSASYRAGEITGTVHSFALNGALSRVMARSAARVIGISRVGTEATATARAVTQAERLAANKLAGKAGEDSVRAIIGKTGSFRWGQKILRPDGLTREVLYEVKNVKYQKLTAQLRAYLEFSQQSGREMILYLPKSARVSSNLQKLIDAGKILRRALP